MSASNMVWQGAGRRIHMQEVGLRDGLQMEKAFVPTADKIALCNALSSAGLSKIEVTSFTSPTAIPALRDAEVVMREITRRRARSTPRWCRTCGGPSAPSSRARMS